MERLLTAGQPVPLLIPRSAILDALWQGFAPEDFCGVAELIGWQQSADRVDAFFANSDIWSGDLLIAADGFFRVWRRF